jgi:hypothetical protein
MASSGGWGFHQLPIRSPPIQQAIAVPPRRPLFQPKPAQVEPAQIQYPRASLLGIAPEIRSQIWSLVDDEVESQRANYWSTKPRHAFEALPLVCRQIYDEVRDSWYTSIVPSNRLGGFLTQSFLFSKLHSFRSLSIEIPFEVTSNFISDMSSALGTLAPYLENLQLFFVGADAYGTPVRLHGCGNQLPDAASRDIKLPADGQAFELRHPLVNALMLLENLKALTVSNANLPLMQTHIIKNKPYLEKLCVVVDPRTTLHLPYTRRNCGFGVLRPVTGDFPPVKELYLCSNSVIGASQVPRKLSLTLEKLTWFVPNVARQAGSLSPHWHTETGLVLEMLRSNSKRLHTFRLCMEGYVYEGNVSYGDFIGAFKEHIPRITSLRHLEIHLWSKSPFIAKEFILSLPRSLEHFYVSDRFVTASELFRHLKARYLPHLVTKAPSRMFDGDEEADESEIRPSAEASRTDRISLLRGNLGFVSYEYDDTEGARFRTIARSTRAGEGVSHIDEKPPTNADEVGLKLSILNAHLLDMERNKHLARFETAPVIPPLLAFTDARPTNIGQLRSLLDIAPHYSSATKTRDGENFIHNDEVAEPTEDFEDNETNFQFSNDSFEAYFGDEDEAELVFKAERVRRPETILPLRYPVVVPCPTGHEDHEHWMCP